MVELAREELVGLGAAVREEPLYSDALARETMRRARVNIFTTTPIPNVARSVQAHDSVTRRSVMRKRHVCAMPRGIGESYGRV